MSCCKCLAPLPEPHKVNHFFICQLLGAGASVLIGHPQCCVTLGKTLSFSESLLLTYKTREWTLINPKAPSNSDIPHDVPFMVAAERQERRHRTPHLLAWASSTHSGSQVLLQHPPSHSLFLVPFLWSLGSASCSSHPPLPELNQATLTPSTKCI